MEKKIFVISMLLILSFNLTGCSDIVDFSPASTDFFELEIEEPRGEGEVTPKAGRHKYREGTTVQLSAVPEDDWIFQEWVGNVAQTENENTSILIEENESVKAVFAENIKRQVILSREGSGEGELSGGGTYQKGEEVTLEATPEENSVFTTWESEQVEFYNPDAASTEFAMPAEKVEVSGYFEKVDMYQVTLHKAPDVTGEGDPGSLQGAGKYSAEETVSIDAESNQGWEFAGWEWKSAPEGLNFSQPDEKTTEFDMPAEDVEVNANFNKIPYNYVTVKALDGNDHRGTLQGGGGYYEGEEVTVSAEPEEGYSFVRWHYDDEKISLDNPGEKSAGFDMIDKNLTLEAEFISGPHEENQ